MLYDWGTLSDAGPRPLTQDVELAAYLLTPGLSRACFQRALGVSNATIWKYMDWARELARDDPRIGQLIAANVSSITREDGLLMAQRRGACQLPFWSRLAIFEFLQIYDAARVANIFRCSRRTVHNVRAGRCTGYDPLTGVRQLSVTQTRPPASRH
jgi:hypothetical protein